ncbi:MAG TPA: hypothetical protein ACQGQI_00205 [Xylella sp.]
MVERVYHHPGQIGVPDRVTAAGIEDGWVTAGSDALTDSHKSLCKTNPLDYEITMQGIEAGS